MMRSIIDAIGNTPLIDLSRLTKPLDGRILLKLEYLNPGSSKKDRAALRIIEDAEHLGILHAEQPVVEMTSGNMGTGLAIVCAVKGYPFIAVMSEGNSIERAKMMRAIGAEVVLVKQAANSRAGYVSGEDLKLVDAQTREIVQQRGAFRVDQFTREGNWQSYADTAAREILEQTSQIDAFCDFVGSGGTFRGFAHTFKMVNPSVRCYIVEPCDAAVLAGRKIVCQNHRIQGGGYAMQSLKSLQGIDVDGYLQVTDERAIECARMLASTEGVFAGFSTGANVAAALELLAGEHRGGTIVTIAADSGLKYMTTDLWM